MRTVAEEALAACLSPETPLREVEAHIFAAGADDALQNAYDTDFGNVYEWVACNPLYNRLVWGYSVGRYAEVTREALAAGAAGPVLDLACGSLAFTARSYLRSPDRVVICSDQSLKMLRMARQRLVRLHGKVPENMTFLLADALRLPLRPRCVGAVVCLNLLHCVADVVQLLRALDRIVVPGAAMHFTTLAEGGRLADGYLAALARAGKLVSRRSADLERLFREAGVPLRLEMAGNLAFIKATASVGRES